MIQENEALKHFRGNDAASSKDCLHYHIDYDISILTYLVQLQSSHGVLKCVFKSGVTEAFVKQLRSLSILANVFKCPAFFISQETAGMDSSHFLCGVLFEGQLLIINPLGDHFNRDAIACFSEISDPKGGNFIVHKVYVSTDKIQKDPEGLSSCGPICVELLKTFCQGPGDIKAIFKEWLSLSTTQEINKDGFRYYGVSVKSLFVSKSLEDMTSENCKIVMEKIRFNHCEELKSLPITKVMQSKLYSEQVSVKEENLYLQNEVMNAPEQVLIFKLSFESLSLLNLEEDESYTRLKNKLSGNTGSLVSKKSEPNFTLFRLKQDPIKLDTGWELDVPGDDSCLFWCILFAYLLPVIDQDKLFSDRFLKAFGNEVEKEFLRKNLQEYNPFGNIAIFTHSKMKTLVQKEFRGRIIGVMRDNPDKFKDFHETDTHSQNEYLEKMSRPSAWGGEPEIFAASILLQCNIILDMQNYTSQIPDPIDPMRPTIEIKHVPVLKESEREGSNDKNHYHFLLSNKVMSKYLMSLHPSAESPFLLIDDEAEVLDREDLASLKEIFEQVLINEILREVKYTIEKIEVGNLRESNNGKKFELENRMRVIADTLSRARSLDWAIGSINSEEPADTTSENFQGKSLNLNLNLLKVSLEIFATHASLRYEPYIAERISKYPLLGVMPLARIGARRIMEFLGRARSFYGNSFEKMTFCDVFLDGLIFGKSYRRESSLIERNVVKVRAPLDDDEKTARFENDADAVFSRGGICIMDPDKLEGSTKLVLYKRSSNSEVMTEIKKTKMVKKLSGIFPKYSFMLLERRVADRYVLNDMDKYDICRENVYKSSVHFATLDEMLDYSRLYQELSQKDGDKSETTIPSFIEWIRGRLPEREKNAVLSVWILPISRKVKMDGKERLSIFEYLSFINSGEDDSSKLVISGNFSNVSLRGLDIRNVGLSNVVLDGADCRYIKANKVTFRNVSMRNTRLECSDLRDAILIDCVIVKSNLMMALIDGIQYGYEEESNNILMKTQQEEEERLEKDLDLEFLESSKTYGNKLDMEYGHNDSEESELRESERDVLVGSEGTYHLHLNLSYIEKYILQKLHELLELKNALDAENSNKDVIHLIDGVILKLFRVYKRIKINENTSEIDLYRIVPQFDILQHKSAIRDLVSKVKDEMKNCPTLSRTKSMEIGEILEKYGQDVGKLDFIGDKGSKVPTLNECNALDQYVPTHGSSRAMLQQALLSDSKRRTKPLLERSGSRDIFSQNPIKQVQMLFVNDSVLRKRLHDILFNIRGAMEKERDNNHPSCYISYVLSEERNRKNLASFNNFLIQLRIHLRLAGIQALLDIVDCKADTDMKSFYMNIEKVDFVLMICTTSALKIKQNKGDLNANPEFSLIMKKRQPSDGFIFKTSQINIHKVSMDFLMSTG